MAGTVILAVSMTGMAFADGDTVKTGTNGDNASYVYDSSTGEIVFSGTGTLDCWEFPDWSVIMYDIKKVVINEGFDAIGEESFIECESIESIELPDSVETMGERAFSDCIRLNSIEWGSGLKELPYRAFSGCEGLKSLKLPDTLEKLGTCAFSECYGLEEIDLGKGVTHIGENAFMTAVSLKKLEIPDNVVSVGSASFALCDSLESVYIGEGLKELKGSSFESENIKTLTISEKNKNLIKKDGIIYNGDLTCVFAAFPPEVGKIVEFPDTVKEIGFTAMTGCNNMEILILLKGFTKFDELVLVACKNLKQISISEGVSELPFSFLVTSESLEKIYIPVGVTKIDEGALCECAALKDVYYGGTEEEWNAIEINGETDRLTAVKFHFNHKHTYVTEEVKEATNLEEGLLKHSCECGDIRLKTTDRLKDLTDEGEQNTQVPDSGAMDKEPATGDRVSLYYIIAIAAVLAFTETYTKKKQSK